MPISGVIWGFVAWLMRLLYLRRSALGDHATADHVRPSRLVSRYAGRHEATVRHRQQAGSRGRPPRSSPLCSGVMAACILALSQPSVAPAAAVHAQLVPAPRVTREHPPGHVAAASSREPLAVTYHEGRLSVHAEHIPLSRLLEEVARQTGLEVRGRPSLQPDMSVQFAELPLLDGLRRLLAHVDHLLLIEYSPQGRIERMQAEVFGGEIPSSSRPLAAQATTPWREGSTLEVPGQAITDADPRVRRWRVEQLGARGDAQALAPLLAALGDADPGVRQGAVASLTQYGERGLEAVQALLPYEPDHAVRLVALQVMGQVGKADDHTGALLHAMLMDDDPQTRAAVVAAFGSVGGPRATEALHTAARDRAPEVRLAALQALARSIHDAAARATVTQHLDDTDETVRDAAAALLETFTE
ncbi:MAG TPA: HEAT repeat domain-containing protein [Candidatus Tectomicrobia bacterium]